MPREENAAREKVNRLTEEALERLIAELKAGRSDTLRSYLAAMGRFHRYSWTNTLLIHSQRRSATRVAGYHTWRELGRSVRRGEKGIMIYAPVVTKTPEPDKPPLSGVKPAQEIPRVTGFRAAYVFDVQQTEGKPLPAFATTSGDPKDYGEKLKAVIADRGIVVEYDPAVAPADGASSGGRISLRPGLSHAEEFSVLTHELAHELLHHGPDRGSVPVVVRETQAEAVAFVVSHGIGLETGSAAADYIALYNGDARTLEDSLAAIQETSSRILNDLLPQERSAAAPTRTSPGLHKTDAVRDAANRDATDSIPERPPQNPDLSDSLSLDR